MRTRALRTLVAILLVAGTLTAAIPTGPADGIRDPSVPRVAFRALGSAGPSDPLGGRPAIGPAPFSVHIILPSFVSSNSPFPLVAIAQGGAGSSYRYTWQDSLGLTGFGAMYGIIPPSTGSVSASVTVFDAVNDTATASAALDIGYGPSIAIGTAISATDVGEPVPFTISVAGLQPPFTVQWTAEPGGGTGRTQLDAPGTWQSIDASPTLGNNWIQANVTDADGSVATAESVVAYVSPPPTLSLHGPLSVPFGQSSEIRGLLTGGSPPFAWTVGATLPSTNASAAAYLTGPGSPIVWTGRFLETGTARIVVELTDEGGATVAANLTVRVFPPLAAQITIGTGRPVPDGSLPIALDLVGGLPPFTCALHLSDGERLTGIALSAGAISFTAHPTASGPLTIVATVHDAAEEAALLTSVVDVGTLPTVSAVRKAPSTAASIGPAAFTPVLGLLGLGAAGIAGASYWWRRRPKRPPGGPGGPTTSPAAVLERLLRGSDGIDRSALRLLAEEAGIAPSAAEAALAHLTTAGRVEVVPGPGGADRFRWIAGRVPGAGDVRGGAP